MKILPTVTAILLLLIAFPQQSRLAQLDCSDPLDIFFALDSSDSLSIADFNLEKQLVNDLLQRLIDSGRSAKAGYLTFTTSVTNIRSLISSLQIVQFELNNVIFDGEGTSLLVPLTYVYNNIFNPTNPNLQPNSRRLFFHITDGRDEINSVSQLAEISGLLEGRNVTIITIGIGDLVDLDQLSAIASQPHEQNLIRFSDLNEAIGNISNIIDRTCTIPKVQGVSVTVDSSVSLTIRWTPYTFTTVISYKICLKVGPGECNMSYHDIGPTLSEYSVADLIPNTVYAISVFALTDLGFTPISDELEGVTTEAPGTPLQLSVTSVTSTSITVSWEAADGETLNYEICFSLTSGGSCEFESQVTASILEYVQNDLDSNTTYFIRVRGVNSGESGSYSNETTATTELLGRPILLSVGISSYHIITVTWATFTEGVVESYDICFKLNGSNICERNVIVDPTVTSKSEFGLEAYTLYDVSIVAITEQGRSEESNTMTVRTGERSPGAPSSISAVVLSAVEIEISWTPPSSDELYGIIVEYFICVRELDTEACLFELTHNAISPLTITLSSLNPNTVYRVRVRARNGGGLGVYTSDSQITTESLEAVTLTAETVDATRIRLTWTNTTVPSSLIIEAFLTITDSPGGTAPTFRLGLPEAISQDYIVEGFSPATTSYFIIKFFTSVGMTPESNQASATTNETEPSGAPTNFRAEIISTSSIRLLWDPVQPDLANGEIISYTICYGVLNDCTEIIINPTGTLEHTFVDLEPGTTYNFTISASTAIGAGPSTSAINETTNLPGDMEIVLNIVGTTATTIDINWVVLSISVASYEIIIITSGGSESVQINDETQTSYTIMGLQPYTLYNITVRAITPGGIDVYSSESTVLTDEYFPSSAPQNITATADSDTVITVSWGDVIEEDRNGIIIKHRVCVQGQGGGFCVFLAEVSTPATQTTVSELTSNTEYTVSVRAYTSAGAGPYSMGISVITLPEQPEVEVTVENGPVVTINGNISDSENSVSVCVRLISDTTTECINVSIIVNDTSFSGTTDELDPNEEYEVVVIATGPGGDRESDPVNITTLPEAPEGTVQNIQTFSNSTSILVNWTEPIVNDDYITYYITISIGGVVINTIETSDQFVEFTGLEPNTDYNITITPSNSVGNGTSITITAQTEVCLCPPEEPDVEIIVENGPLVTINGNLSESGGSVSDVTICVTSSSNTECTNISITADNTSFSVITDELDPNEVYEVVVILTGPGGTTESDPVNITTLPEAPEGSVQNIQTFSNSTSILVNWTEPIAINDDYITYYITISIGGVVINTIETSDQFVEFTGLEPNTPYDITITPSNSVGNGTSITSTTITEQEPPEPLQIISVDNNSVLVTLTPVNSTSNSIPIDHYEVCVQSIVDTCDDIIIVQPNDNLTFRIEDLTPNTEYTFTVVAHIIDHTGPIINDLPEESPSSFPSTVTTSPSAPIDAVTNLQAVVNELYSLNVSWNFIATSSESAPTHFYVCLALTSGGNCTIETLVTAEVNSVEITDVEGDTDYYVMVYAWNLDGFGPVTEIMITTPTFPSPQVNVVGTALSPYEIFFEWETSDIFLNISSFTVCISVNGDSSCNETIYEQPINNGEVVFSGLAPNTTYSINIIELDPEKNQSTIYVQTLLHANSDSPINVQVATLSSTILRVTWEPSSETLFTNLTAWEVCYSAERFIETDGCVTSEIDEFYKSIISLEEYEYYKIKVRAVYSNGTGTEFSVPVMGRTEQDVPSKAISELSDYEENGVPKYGWLAPPLIDQNGIIMYYMVVFEYEFEGIEKIISYREDAINREIMIPSKVTIPYNISVTPYTIGAGPTYKLIGSEVEPIQVQGPCPDSRIAITVLCVLLAALIILAIVMCVIILILAIKKSSSVYSAV